MDQAACGFCFESSPVGLYPCGCACRSDSTPACLHVECAFEEIATRLTERPGPNDLAAASMRSCFICKHEFTGPFARLLSRKILEASGTGSGPYSVRFAAMVSHAAELLHSGSYAECEEMLREAEAIGGRCISIDAQRALCLAKTDRLVEAEASQRGILARARELYGETNVITTSHAHNLAATLALGGRHTDAVELLRLVHQTEATELGTAHDATLKTGAMLGHVLISAKHYTEAVGVLRDVHASMRRVFGANGPTLVVACNLAKALFHSNDLREAESIQRDACAGLAELERIGCPVAGLTENDAKLSLALTLCSQRRVSEALAIIREQYPAPDFGPFAQLVKCIRRTVFPKGSAVTLHGLASQPGLNGTRAVIIGFDEAAFRYRIRLTDGSLVSVRFECAASDASGP